jgi:integrase
MFFTLQLIRVIALSAPRTVDQMMKMPARRKTAKKSTATRTKAGRDYLTGLEVGKLIAATKGTRNEASDRCLLLLMFRHGLRVSETCRLKLEQVDTKGRLLHTARLSTGYRRPIPYAPTNSKQSAHGSSNAPGCSRTARRSLRVSNASHCTVRPSIFFSTLVAKPPPSPSLPIRTCYATVAASP